MQIQSYLLGQSKPWDSGRTCPAHNCCGCELSQMSSPVGVQDMPLQPRWHASRCHSPHRSAIGQPRLLLTLRDTDLHVDYGPVLMESIFLAGWRWYKSSQRSIYARSPRGPSRHRYSSFSYSISSTEEDRGARGDTDRGSGWGEKNSHDARQGTISPQFR